MDGPGSWKASAPYRAIPIGCDPRAQAELDVTICRVQTIVGGKVLVIPTLDGKPYRPANLACGVAGHWGQAQPADPKLPRPVWAESVNLAPAYAPVAGFTPVARGAPAIAVPQDRCARPAQEG